MQTVQTYPAWQQVAAAAPPRSGVIAFLRALTLSVWLASLVINYWWRSQWNWAEDFYEQEVNIRSHYLVGLLVVLVAHLTLGIPAWFNAPFRALSTWPGRLFTLFCLLMLASSPFSASITTSGLYAAATWCVFLLCHLYWSSDYYVVRRAVVISGGVLFAWLFALLVHHGMPNGFGYGIGGINRNAIATLGMAGMIFCMLSANRTIRWGSIALCGLFALAVNSRGSILAWGIFLALYYMLHKGTWKAAAHAALALFAAVCILLASTVLKDIIFEDVMKLNDPARGLGTGMTGRVESWRQGLERFWERPLFGHGFRAQLAGEGLSAHGGYVTLLIEAGILGTLLAVGAIILEAIRRIHRARLLRSAPAAVWNGIDVEESLRLNAIACCTMVTMLTYWIYEPVYLNLGTVMSVAFFLMLAAPEFAQNRRGAVPVMRHSAPAPHPFGRAQGSPA
jgi:O-antigen ligase